MLTHEHLVKKLLERPGVRKEFEALLNEEAERRLAACERREVQATDGEPVIAKAHALPKQRRVQRGGA